MSQSESTQPAIEIKNISKKFIIPKYNRNSLKEVVVNGLFKNEKTEHQVLDDISFTIERGDFFGIVGRNGSGKSTLLKLICGIYAPDAGEIKLHGKLTPFIELGVGFNPELSGRDNVYLNGALLGFTRPQMEAMYDEIVEFAELEEFMDLKLKNYSSGMQVRLAFSIAIKAKNDILIFDEVLAVGDEAFQRKCVDIFEKYKAEGQTVVLVTHNMETVKKFCNKAALIQDGEIAQIGQPNRVADSYSTLNLESVSSSVEKKQNQNSPVKVSVDKPTYNVKDNLVATIVWPKSIKADSVMLDLFKKSGELVTNFISKREGIDELTKNKLTLLTSLPVTTGTYYFDVSLWKDGQKIFSEYEVCEFVVSDNWPEGETKNGGLLAIGRSWEQ